MSQREQDEQKKHFCDDFFGNGCGNDSVKLLIATFFCQVSRGELCLPYLYLYFCQVSCLFASATSLHFVGMFFPFLIEFV